MTQEKKVLGTEAKCQATIMSLCEEINSTTDRRIVPVT